MKRILMILFLILNYAIVFCSDSSSSSSSKSSTISSSSSSTVPDSSDPAYQKYYDAKIAEIQDEIQNVNKGLPIPDVAKIVFEYASSSLQPISSEQFKKNSEELFDIANKIKKNDENDLKRARELIESGEADVNYQNKIMNKRTPLMQAIQGSHIELIKLLLSHPDIDVNMLDKDSKTALSFASYKGLTEIVKLLLEHSAAKTINNRFGYWNRTTKKKQSALSVAANKEIADLLRKYGATE